jgi:hypothetical protein
MTSFPKMEGDSSDAAGAGCLFTRRQAMRLPYN